MLFSALSKAGGKAFSNMAVGYNNVDVDAATRHGIAVGNTPVSGDQFGIVIVCLLATTFVICVAASGD